MDHSLAVGRKLRQALTHAFQNTKHMYLYFSNVHSMTMALTVAHIKSIGWRIVLLTKKIFCSTPEERIILSGHPVHINSSLLDSTIKSNIIISILWDKKLHPILTCHTYGSCSSIFVIWNVARRMNVPWSHRLPSSHNQACYFHPPPAAGDINHKCCNKVSS